MDIVVQQQISSRVGYFYRPVPRPHPVKCGEQKKRDPDTHKRCAGQPKEMTTTSGRELLCDSDAEVL